MSKILNILMVLVISLLSWLSFLSGSCKTTTEAKVIYIPPSYYGCIAVSVDALLGTYFGRNGNLLIAEKTYNGQIFVFYSARVVASMLVDENTLNYSRAQCIAMQPGAVGKLKVGDIIDIVGINQGPLPEAEGKPLSEWFDSNGMLAVFGVNGWLYFTDCIFIPSGSVQLPAPGGAVFARLY